MAKLRKLGGDKIKPGEWLYLKPYKNFTPYDKYYAGMAEKVYDILRQQNPWFREYDLGHEDIARLACILTSFFEDFINEIGIWKVFTKTNKKLFGYHIPFYDMEGYDPEYLNPADFTYLTWHWMCMTVIGKMFAPDSPAFLMLGDQLYELFEPEIDNAPVTALYEKYLTIPDDIHFFELKTKLKWMTKFAYVPGASDVGLKMASDILQWNVENQQVYDEKMMAGFAYGIEEDYIFQKNSSFSALSVLDWFVGIIQCSTQMKQHILNLRKRVIGEFLYEGHDQGFWHFRHVVTDKPIQVVRESVNIDTRDTKKGDLFLLQLATWKGEWWLSGTLANFGRPSPSMIEKSKQNIQSIPFYLYPAQQQDSLREDAAGMEKFFLEYFGKRVVLFDNQANMNKAMDGFIEYCNQMRVTDHAAAEKAKETYAKKYKERAEESWEALKDWDDGEGVALMYVPGTGQAISTTLPRLIALLKKDKLPDQEKAPLFYSLLGDTHPTIVKEVMRSYPTKNLVFPIASSRINALEHAGFFMRFLSQDEFSEPLPKVRYLPEQMG